MYWLNLEYRLDLTGIGQNFIRSGTGGCVIPVCIAVRNFSAITVGTERNEINNIAQYLPLPKIYVGFFFLNKILNKFLISLKK